jgi:hypothetical protein
MALHINHAIHKFHSLSFWIASLLIYRDFLLNNCSTSNVEIVGMFESSLVESPFRLFLTKVNATGNGSIRWWRKCVSVVFLGQLHHHNRKILWFFSATQGIGELAFQNLTVRWVQINSQIWNDTSNVEKALSDSKRRRCGTKSMEPGRPSFPPQRRARSMLNVLIPTATFLLFEFLTFRDECYSISFTNRFN